jgi:phosphoglycolate phosphatase
MLTIVFDLDGTLIDTAPDLIDALNFTLAGHALPTVPYAQARSLIGGGAWGMIERALILEGRTAATADVDTLYASFVAHYGEHVADRSRPFPELEPVLDRLAQAGHRFAVCTNKLERLSKRLLDALQLSDRFTAICGPDTFGIHKPDPQMFRATVLKAGGEPTVPSWSGTRSPTSGLPGRRTCRWWRSILAIRTCRWRRSGRTG